MKKSILITGATGTFGKAFIRRYSKSDDISKIILFSRDEFKQHNMKLELVETYGAQVVEDKFRFFLGDVRDAERILLATRDVDVIIHAAALKHVPFCEYNPSEAILTNVNGTKNVCDAAIKNGVRQVVVLSTDKAVEPINFYGSTKILGEKYAIHSNLYAINKTSISCVRYGNIFGSRGSIIETFKKQLHNESKAFDITDNEMTRFWMHINDAADLVMWTIQNSIGGEVVVPKIKASKLVDIAAALDSEKPHNVIGIRQGEKIHEQLFSRREYDFAYESKNAPYFVVVPENSEFNYLRRHYENAGWKKCKRKTYASDDADLQMSLDEIRSMIDDSTK